MDYESEFIVSLAKILSLGSKFVPLPLFNRYTLFKNLYYSIDKCMQSFNSYLFFKKTSKINESSINSTDNSVKLDKNDFLHIDQIDLNRVSNKVSFMKHIDKIPILEETMLLRFKLLNDLKFKKFDYFSNLSLEQLNTLTFFIKHKPFKIMDCDKNLGVAFIKHDDYDKIALEHLDSSNSYKCLNYNPIDETINEINSCVGELFKSKHISKQLFDKVFINRKCSLGKFRVLAKLHKSKFGIRPIINCTNQPTENICVILDILFKSILNNVVHILKDSQQLLQFFDSLYIKSKPFIYSMDFESLYTSMIPDATITTICDFMLVKLNSVHMDITALFVFLKLVFSKNIFRFNKRVYVQNIGIAMGCKCGPSLANLYLYILESKWLKIHRPLAYFRFIDDILIVSLCRLNLELFRLQFEYLKLNIVIDDSVNFLDLNVSYDGFLCKLKFKLYIKPTYNGSYLVVNSNHPSHIFRNIPKSLFLRIRKICSSFIDYLIYSSKVYVNLVQKGYDSKYLDYLRVGIAFINRSDLLPYKVKNGSNGLVDQVKTFFDFDRNFHMVKSLFIKNFYEVSSSSSWMMNLRPFFVYKIKPNLSLLTVHSLNFNLNFNSCFTRSCLNNCKICSFIYGSSYIKVNNSVLPMLSNANCDSCNVVYIIMCTKCTVFYVGETSKSLRIRISQHLNGIKRFVPYFNMENEVAYHFRRVGHVINSDFRVCVFRENLVDQVVRRSVEMDLIWLFKCVFNFEILNSKINNLNSIKNFSFL